MNAAHNGSYRIPSLAFWLETESKTACEMAKLIGYDAVILDFEHGVISRKGGDQIFQFCKSLGLSAIARVGATDRQGIQHALDSGASGVIIPQINSLAEAEHVCKLAKYPPLGTRGMGYSRTSNYSPVDDDFIARENRRTLCIPMIETQGAYNEVDAIAELPTVDGLFIGPSDLSLARGRGAYRRTKEDFADLNRIAAAALSASKGFMLPAPSVEVFEFALKNGAQMVTICDDLSALMNGLKTDFISRKIQAKQIMDDRA